MSEQLRKFRPWLWLSGIAAIVTILTFFDVRGDWVLTPNMSCHGHPLDFSYAAKVTWCDDVPGFSLILNADDPIPAIHDGNSQWRLFAALPTGETIHLRQDGGGEHANIIMYQRCTKNVCEPWQKLVSAKYQPPL